jgi:23S rRNA (cytidine2498-2'-O)-methyltransferase
MTTAYLAAEGLEHVLAEELRFAQRTISSRHGNLFISEDEPVEAFWAINTWFDAEWIDIASIGDASRALRDRQRNWASYAVEHRGRAKLITEKLPYVSAKPLAFAQPAPSAPLGSWTLVTPNVMLAAARCSSPFPNGQPQFVEDRDGPPNRAYLKLWEALSLARTVPNANDRVLDLGASPGGWTWSLAKLGAQVLAVDRAPLDRAVAALPNVTWRGESAFGLDPRDFSDVQWLVSDIIGYPDKILRLLNIWYAHVPNIICTIKFQGEPDHAVAREFAALPDARVVHLFHNKNELTVIRTASSAAPEATQL